MKQPTRTDTINLRVWKTSGVERYENITGINVYPLAIHRPTHEFEEIKEGSRSRYSGVWHITHIPTGKSFGIRAEWSKVVYYVDNIIDEPALLMLTDKTMTEHPCFQQLSDKHFELRRQIGY